MAEERAKLIESIHASPCSFVAQERVNLSQAPAWAEDHLAARPVVVRAFVANGGDSFSVMPGGLTRVSGSPDELAVSMQRGGGSKDTWVLADGSSSCPEPTQVMGESGLAGQISPGVPSRVADHLFWLGRYTERLEQLLRMLRCVLSRVSGEPSVEGGTRCKELGEFAAKLGVFPPPLGSDPDSSKLSRRMLHVLYHPDQRGGVRDLLKRVRLTASAVRDRFSDDTWRILGRLEVDGRSRPGRLPLAQAMSLIHNLVLDLAAFNGMEMENMTRGHGWRFLDFGRRLERGQSVLKLLRAAAKIEAPAAAVLEPVLEIADSMMTYRRRYFASPQLPGVLDLLLRDESNPRSLLFQVNVLHEHIAALVVDCSTTTATLDHKRLQSLATALRSLVLEELAVKAQEPLLYLLSTWATDLARLSDQVTNHYFSHSVPRLS
jgi:uncharacterized alpha-E superfamily protein